MIVRLRGSYRIPSLRANRMCGYRPSRRLVSDIHRAILIHTLENPCVIDGFPRSVRTSRATGVSSIYPARGDHRPNRCIRSNWRTGSPCGSGWRIMNLVTHASPRQELRSRCALAGVIRIDVCNRRTIQVVRI